MSGIIKVPFHDDEIAVSFVSRMARANGRPWLRGFLKDFGLQASLIDTGDAKEVAKLAAILDTPTERLAGRLVVLNVDETFDFARSTFKQKALFRRKLRVCPQCIQDDEADETRMPGTRRYARTAWIFPSVDTCVRHDLALEYAKYHVDTRVPNISDMLDEAAATYSDATQWRRQPSNAFERFVVQRLNNEVGHGELLDELSLAAAIDCCQLFGRAAAFGKNFNTRQQTDEDNRRANLMGFKALREGADGVRAILSSMGQDQTATVSTAVRALYGNLYEALRVRGGHEYDRIREIVRDHTNSTAPRNSAWSFWNGDGGTDHSDWVSPHSVAKELGIKNAALQRLLKHRAISVHRSGSRTSVISRADAESLVRSYRETIGGSDVMSMLGLSNRDLIWLAESGTLVPSQEFEQPRQGVPARYSKVDVVNLFDRLPKSRNTQGLKQLFRVHVRADERRTDIHKAIFNGELSKLVYIPSISLSRSAWVDPDELVAVLAKKATSQAV